ncbi:S-layer homology domain-containing protein [Brunnivagina elsteri]|uniref:S-layer protein n=1 Tax=Brunnivagina elsteri CCALA 953 TaxID=987040 RepID=A0A2A2TEY3_9CYAN|nr:S-layer homology domain-containing protein [Calothrix elsteri]PAX51969.1 S-layer protein [Calothrix elsteri CCALA 953]
MTNLPPSDPRSTQRNSLDFDDFIGVLVAFATIGSILFWALSRQESKWNFGQLMPSLSPTVVPNLQPNPQAGIDNNLLLSMPKTEVQPNLVTQVPVIPNSDLSQDDAKPGIPAIEIPVPEKPKEIPSVPGAGVFGFIPPLVDGNTPNISPSIAPKPQVTTTVAKLPTIPPPRAFTDVPDKFWAQGFINALSSRKIIEGFEDYSFRPNQPINRAEFAAIVNRAFKKEIGQTKLSFNDIPQKYWATGAINDAIATGFMKGFPDKSFKPDQKIPRAQVLVALISGLNLKTPASPEKVVSIYKDAKDIPKYAIPKVAAATIEGLVVNYPDKGSLAPNREITRAEAAAMIHQALVKMGRLQPIKSENIVKAPK